MQVINQRKGFATNSSSSHSIIFSADSSRFPSGRANHGDFQWEFFVQKSVEEKLDYIYQCFSDVMSDQEMADYFDVPREMVDSVKDIDGSIDHESVGLLSTEMAKMVLHSDNYAILGGNDNSEPPSWTERFEQIDNVAMDRALKDYHDFLNSGKERLVTSTSASMTAIEEGVLTTFDSITGTKKRFNMNGDGEVYLSVPELVDIKITDYCPYGCSYCYQDSTVDGQHANYQTLLSMVDYLKSQGVFELAIGGGEPTLHPHFVDILEACREADEHGNHIVPNFTTRNVGLFKQSFDTVASILMAIGGYAFSVDGVDDIRKWEKAAMYWLVKANELLKHGMDNPREFTENDSGNVARRYVLLARRIIEKASIQVVLGSMSRSLYIDTLNGTVDALSRLITFQREVSVMAGVVRNSVRGSEGGTLKHFSIFSWSEDSLSPTVMLLGYKTTGRGSEPEYDYSDTALSDVKQCCGGKLDIGIDTAAAQQLKSEIEQHAVPPEYYYIKEGVASCYIDAVNETMASSSYGSEIENNTMDAYHNDTFIDVFSKYQRVGLNAIPLKFLV